MTPKMEAIAFRIWQVAGPKGWDLTAKDIGETIGVDPSVVGRVVAAKGWNTRLRANKLSTHFIGPGIIQHGFSPIEMGWDQ